MRPFRTERDRSREFNLDAIGNEFTRGHFDGPFYQSRPRDRATPCISLVFVQSRDGNTEADDPSSLGGGETDKHLIYEGLSRVSADAVMAGGRTVGDANLLFSVWHPELVALRAALGRARHPTQIVTTRTGSLPIEAGMLFNVPEIAVLILSTPETAGRLKERARQRPWITVLPGDERGDVRAYARRLRTDAGIERISAVGGRTLATELLEAGLVSDLYLTTSPRDGGAPGTPMYAGERPPRTGLVLRKRDEDGVVFEHLHVTP